MNPYDTWKKYHQNNIQKLCRLCGRKLSGAHMKKSFKPLNDHLKGLASAAGLCVDFSNDELFLLPKRVCSCCVNKLLRYENKSNPIDINVFKFTFYRNRNCQDDPCDACQEALRKGFREKSEISHKKKIGRPLKSENEPKRSPCQLVCNKCQKPTQNILYHKASNQCQPVYETTKELIHRVKKVGTEDVVLKALLTDKKPSVVGDTMKVKNIHGKKSNLRIGKTRRVSQGAVVKMKRRVGGKGMLPNTGVEELCKILKEDGFKTENPRNLWTEKQHHMDNLFIEEEHSFEFGKKYPQYQEKSYRIAYCKSINQLIHKILQLHKIQIAETGIDENIKIGIDHGQGYLKVTLQVMSLGKNSVKSTIILAATEAPETPRNIYKIVKLLNLEAEIAKVGNMRFSNDVKVVNQLYGIMQGNTSYPCTYCTWKSSSPLDEKGEDRSP